MTASTTSRDEPPALTLTPNFATSLRLALTGGGDHQSFGVPSTDTANDDIDVDIVFLDDYARSQWEGILHYVVNSGVAGVAGVQQGSSYPEANVRQLLELGRLVDAKKGRNPGMGITQAGFTFLLQEVNAQVWTLLLLWIENAESMEMDSVDVLSFLFMLGSLELGLAYSTTTLTPTQSAMLQNLIDFGLIYIPPSSTPPASPRP